MVFGFTSYVDPGVYQQEVIVPSGINLAAQPFAVCLIGTASRNKRVTNESVVRGVLKAEALTPASTSPHTAQLAHRSDRRIGDTNLSRTLNGISSLVLPSFVSFNAAYVQSTLNETTTVDLTTNNAFALRMDGMDPVTIIMTNGSGATTFLGRQITVQSTFSAIGAATNTEIVTAINKALNDATVLGFGTAYASAASLVTVAGHQFLRITSPLTSPVSDVQVSAPFVTSALTTTFGAVAPDNSNRQAQTIITISDLIWNASATWKVDYVNIDSLQDPLVQTSNVQDIVTVGSTPGGTDFQSLLDWNLTSNKVDWSPDTAAVVTGIAGNSVGGNFDLGLNDQLALELDGKLSSTAGSVFDGTVKLVIDLVGMASPPIGYVADPGTLASGAARSMTITATTPDSTHATLTDAGATFDSGLVGQTITISGFTSGGNNHAFVVTAVTDATHLVFANGAFTPANETHNAQWTFGAGSAATPANVATNINSVLAAAFGPAYEAVASVVTVSGHSVLRLTSPQVGQASSSIAVDAASTNSAHTVLFGGVVTTVMGTGKRPSYGTKYFVSYDFTRPSTDYEIPFRHFSVESAMAQVGNPSAVVAAYNPLSVAAQIAFENGANFIYTVQANDTAEGNPTRQQIKNCLDGAGTVAGATEIVVLDEPGTRLDVTTDMIAHLETQCSPTEKHYRRIWCGMANNTAIGDRDTPASMVGRATRTLQVSSSSPGRGRMFLMAPPQLSGVTRTVGFEDGTSARISLNGTYLAVAAAAARTALSGPAETLTGKTLTGFNTDDITAFWKTGERRAMAGNGLFVITFDAGLFKMLDAMSTENGGGGLEQFAVDSTSYQKDIIVTKVDQALEANIVGIVPFDLASFILDIKLVIQGVITAEISKGTIGPYRDKTTGAIRVIDPRVDIRVAQNVNILTEFDFAYWFNLRYPALRLLGQYSVDNPFFALSA